MVTECIQFVYRFYHVNVMMWKFQASGGTDCYNIIYIYESFFGD
nr:MAG TPA: hypothetical protein [Bacteriophage sp.]